MEIKLGEDDGFLNGGVPRLVVVSVTYDDGRCVRFPYVASQTISGLYQELAKVAGNPLPMPLAQAHFDNGVKTVNRIAEGVMADVQPLNGVIEKNDIVKCIFLENRNDHAGSPATIDLVVGGLYRVTKVLAGGYEVLDDKAALKLKLFLMKHEVELVEKHKVMPKKKMFLEEAMTCPKCHENKYCSLIDGFYEGKCDCGQFIRVSRKEFKDGQAGNRNAKTA